MTDPIDSVEPPTVSVTSEVPVVPTPPAPVPPPLNPATEPPMISQPLKLDDLQRQRLETLLWKKRALFHLARRAEDEASRKIDEAKSADLEFLRYARGVGIDIRKSFEISDAGLVKYVEPASPAPANTTLPSGKK